MYTQGSFIVAISILASALITNTKKLGADIGLKSKEELLNENKNYKLVTLFLLLICLIFVFVQFNKRK